jgi:phosphoglycolate phosphatase-like HAD superfamily hydrolase
MAHWWTRSRPFTGPTATSFPSFGLPAPTALEVRRAVGGGLEKAMSHFVSPELIAEACRAHVAYTERILLEDPVLYDGAAELVGALHAQGVKTGVLTNKIGEHARAVLKHLGIAGQLDLILGARDCAWRKPAAEFTAEALRRMGGDAAHCCLVGDSPFDLTTARNAGFPCFCVTTARTMSPRCGPRAPCPSIPTCGRWRRQNSESRSERVGPLRIGKRKLDIDQRLSPCRNWP